MMNGFGEHGWGFGMGFGWIIGLLIIIAIIWIVVKSMNKNNRSLQPNSKSPLDILKERYAQGEIDKQEFEERKRDLM